KSETQGKNLGFGWGLSIQLKTQLEPTTPLLFRFGDPRPRSTFHQPHLQIPTIHFIRTLTIALSISGCILRSTRLSPRGPLLADSVESFSGPGQRETADLPSRNTLGCRMKEGVEWHRLGREELRGEQRSGREKRDLGRELQVDETGIGRSRI
ncbi:unnamed protein product, partial [Ilex paraguariensis]